jgi:hypothetical protein
METRIRTRPTRERPRTPPSAVARGDPSTFDKHAYAHQSGDVKIHPGRRGANVLPGGAIALSRALVE